MLDVRGILLAVLIIGVTGTGMWAANRPGIVAKVLGYVLLLGGLGVAGTLIYRVLHPG